MTTSPLDRVRADLDALTLAWAQAEPALGAGAREGAFGELSGPGLVRVVEGAAQLKRSVEAFLARAGDEVAKRSTPDFGADSLAKQHGHSSPVRLVAAATGSAQSEAARLLRVGEATRERPSFTGEVRAAKFAHVRAALDSGRVSVEAAGLITGMLRRVELHADQDQLVRNEQRLVDLAAQSPLSLVARAVKVAEAQLDADDLASADARRHAERSVTFREDADGVFHLRACLDPVTAAPLKAALDALVSDALRRRVSGSAGTSQGDRASGGDRGAAGASGGLTVADGPTGAVIEDQRSIPQIRADALAELARHALGCATAPGSVPKTTIVVRMSLDALREGLGMAEIDGIDQPIAAATARKLAGDAEVIPAVFGGDSVPLDLGRATRLFSRGQRLALMERDGGCASCGTNVTYAEAHHIDWWSRGGPTDLGNGVMLCSHCHHQVHDHGWEIRLGDGQVWFIPPPHLDPARTPRLGGRARFGHKPPADARIGSAAPPGDPLAEATGAPAAPARALAAPAMPAAPALPAAIARPPAHARISPAAPPDAASTGAPNAPAAPPRDPLTETAGSPTVPAHARATSRAAPAQPAATARQPAQPGNCPTAPPGDPLEKATGAPTAPAHTPAALEQRRGLATRSDRLAAISRESTALKTITLELNGW